MEENINVPLFEKNILKKIDYANRLLKIKLLVIDDGHVKPTFKKEAILKIFNELGYKPKYLQGGCFVIYKEYKNYLFELITIKFKSNIFDFQLGIMKNGKFIENRESGMRYILNYLSYDKKLAEEVNSGKYGLNNLDDLRAYLKNSIDLIFEFVNEYIKEIEVGNVPE